MLYIMKFPDYPNKSWYENNELVCFLGAATGTAVMFGMLLSPDRADTKIFIASAVVYIMGSIMDRTTSIQCSNLQQACPLLLEIKEYNPFLPTYPIPDDYFRGPKNTVDILGAIISPLFPPFGIAIGLSRALAALNNARVRDRATLELSEVN